MKLRVKVGCAIVGAAIFLTLVGCGGGESAGGAGTETPETASPLERDLARFIPNEAVREFFAEEAMNAGVSEIRSMMPNEIPVLTHPAQTGCGRAVDTTVLINADRLECINLHNISHEISHIGARCYGHNDVFYSYNLELAERFADEFTQGTRLVAKVTQRSQEYRDNHPC